MHSERPAAGETPLDPVFEGLDDVFDYPPELEEKIAKLMDAAAESREAEMRLHNHYHHYRKIEEIGDFAQAEELRKRFEYANDLTTVYKNAAEHLIKKHGRRQKINRVAGRVMGIIRKPLELGGLGHDAAAETDAV